MSQIPIAHFPPGTYTTAAMPPMGGYGGFPTVVAGPAYPYGMQAFPQHGFAPQVTGMPYIQTMYPAMTMGYPEYSMLQQGYAPHTLIAPQQLQPAQVSTQGGVGPDPGAAYMAIPPPGAMVVSSGGASYMLVPTNSLPAGQAANQQLQPNVVVRKKLASLPATPNPVNAGGKDRERGGHDDGAALAATTPQVTVNRFVKLPEGIPRPKLPIGVAHPTYL